MGEIEKDHGEREGRQDLHRICCYCFDLNKRATKAEQWFRRKEVREHDHTRQTTRQKSQMMRKRVGW